MSRHLVSVAIFLALVAPAAFLSADDKDDKGWAQLFNGKDLTGWKMHPNDKAKWEVKDGAIVGSGEAGHLFTERDDYTNFVVRFEAQINEGGNSGQYFRTQFGKAFPKGYEAQINATHGDPVKTGSLYPAFNSKLTAEQKKPILVLKAPHKANEWFTQEVTADGNHIVIKVNGKVTVDYTDDKNTFTKGHF